MGETARIPVLPEDLVEMLREANAEGLPSIAVQRASETVLAVTVAMPLENFGPSIASMLSQLEEGDEPLPYPQGFLIYESHDHHRGQLFEADYHGVWTTDVAIFYQALIERAIQHRRRDPGRRRYRAQTGS